MMGLLVCVSSLWAQTGSVHFRVVDATTSIVPGAEISLLGPKDQPIRTLVADAKGELLRADLALGSTRFRVRTRGFLDQRLNLIIHDGPEQELVATLQAPPCYYTVSVQASKRRRWQIFR
jgi:hypothetical protein